MNAPRQLSLSELDSLLPLSREFYSSSRFLGEFDIEKFRQIWAQLINGDMGAIFVIEEGSNPVGALGGFIHPELYSGKVVAEEMFWFASQAKRGIGVKLYRHFEQWARDRGAETLQMVHLMDSMPKKLETFYSHMGFEPVEMRYSKRLIP